MPFGMPGVIPRGLPAVTGLSEAALKLDICSDQLAVMPRGVPGVMPRGLPLVTGLSMAGNAAALVLRLSLGDCAAMLPAARPELAGKRAPLPPTMPREGKAARLPSLCGAAVEPRLDAPRPLMSLNRNGFVKRVALPRLSTMNVCSTDTPNCTA